MSAVAICCPLPANESATPAIHPEQATNELLQLLEQELTYLDGGGYHWSWKPRWLLIDSPVCPYRGAPEARGNCSRCPLMALAPPAVLRDGVPCHQIVISLEGESIDSLTRLGSRFLLEQVYRDWLLRKIQDLRDGHGPHSRGLRPQPVPALQTSGVQRRSPVPMSGHAWGKELV